MPENDPVPPDPTQVTDPSPSSEPPTGDVPPEPFRYGDDAPEYLRGKTAQEAAQLTGQLMDVVQQQASMPQPAAQPAQPPSPAQPPQPQPVGLQPPHPDLQLTDAAEWQRQMLAYQNAQTQQAVNTALQNTVVPLVTNLASSTGQMAMDASKREPTLARVWAKYPHEIIALLDQQGVAAESRTKQTWDLAAQAVQGRHFEELAQEVASTKPTVPVTEDGSPGAPLGTDFSGDEIDRFWAENSIEVQRMKLDGHTKQGIRDAAKAMGFAPKQYIEALTSSNVITS